MRYCLVRLYIFVFGEIYYCYLRVAKINEKYKYKEWYDRISMAFYEDELDSLQNKLYVRIQLLQNKEHMSLEVTSYALGELIIFLKDFVKIRFKIKKIIKK